MSSNQSMRSISQQTWRRRSWRSATLLHKGHSWVENFGKPFDALVVDCCWANIFAISCEYPGLWAVRTPLLKMSLWCFSPRLLVFLCIHFYLSKKRCWIAFATSFCDPDRWSMGICWNWAGTRMANQKGHKEHKWGSEVSLWNLSIP
jgi:hypothetical protein